MAGGLLAMVVIAGVGCGNDGPSKQISAESLSDNEVVLEVNGMV